MPELRTRSGIKIYWISKIDLINNQKNLENQENQDADNVGVSVKNI